ncbi:MAG: DUF4340 domain-containing protein, partial [Ruminococcus sp.]|nr:DUF4340 domain-containing protein [Ruminococcus sp.]
MNENKKTPDVIIEDETAQDDLFQSFEKAPAKENKKKKPTATTKTLIIAICSVVILAAVLITLIFLPKENEKEEFNGPASVTSVLDNNKVWQVNVKTKNGEIVNNGSGELLSLVPADIKTIKLENNKGTTVISSYTPKKKTKETDPKTGKAVEKTEQTQYTVKGFENYDLQSGEPAEVASTCSTLSFLSVSCADAAGKLADFGFDNPRSIASVTYNDGTKSVIKVGAKAPQNLGTYVMFGSGNAVFLCETDVANHLLYGITDLVSRTINNSADDTEKSEVKKVTLSGANFKDTVILEPNQGGEIDSDYIITAPEENFADNTEASNISGGLRGLLADKVMAVNPNADRLSKLGLADPYAEVTAVYPDVTIELIASKPDSSGNCSLMKKNGNIVYKITAEKIAWVNSSYEKLLSEYMLNADLKSVKALTVDGYNFDITTKTINTTDDKGEESTSTETKTKFKGKEIDEGNFETFFNNISMLKKSEKTAPAASGKAALKVVYSYSSDRVDDTLEFIKNGASYTVVINGKPSGKVDASYVDKLSSQAKAASKNDQVTSFWNILENSGHLII